jgi:N-acetylneuraminic acid mutarotase
MSSVARLRIALPSLLLLSAAGACGDDDRPAGGVDAGPGMDDGGGTDAGPEEDAGPGDECDTRPADAPDTRGELEGVLDAERGRILAYGGNTAAPEMCMPRYNLVSDMWAFHLDCNSWERLPDATGPGVRARHAATLDTTASRMIIFGGRDRMPTGGYVNFNDVWAYELATDTWSEIAATGDAPPPRSSAAIAYDGAANRIVVFGGNTSADGLVLTGTNDMYALDLGTGVWTEITAASPPAPRLYHTSAMFGHEWLVFGGTPDFDGPYYNDVHAFDLWTETWRQVAGGGPDAPLTRFGAGAFVDAERGRLVVVAGHDAAAMGNRNDMWALDLGAGTWTELHPGDTYNGGSAGFCMFPPDFTTPEDGAPERRYSFLVAQDETRGFVFGGKTDCGNANDVWAVDFATDAWVPLRAATGGIACNRSGATTCSTLCF